MRKPIVKIGIFLLFFFGSIDSIYTLSDSNSIIQSDTQKINKVYLIKSRWHTGIVVPIDSISLRDIYALNAFKKYRYADIGWGDEDFYQDTKDFDLYLAAKALFVPTNSVIRIEGHSSRIEDIVNWSDYCVMFELNDKNYGGLLRFIGNSFLWNEKHKLVVTSTRQNHRIMFFRSIYKYSIANNCNVWAANALRAAGFNVSPHNIITAGNLYDEIEKIGIVLKRNR